MSKFVLESENFKPGTLLQSIEFRFILMRQWTLYDSMYFSNYMASKFHVWKQAGKEDLQKFLVSLGIPLSEAHQKYAYMANYYKT
jgi:cell division control protein 45